jgi:hypothetical protein
MSRIRSVHPGLFTDEAWVSCSPLARILVIGLWTDADDQGVFEWKPLQIKMRLLPGDAANVGELLQEIQRAGMVMAYDVGGKRYGAIKNFRKFQRPQKPNALHPLPDFAASYVGLSATDPEPVRDQYATPPIEAQPMEDGGGKGKGESKPEVDEPTVAAPSGATGRSSRKPKGDKPKTKPIWETDPDFCAAWDACPDRMRKRSESREKTWPIWRDQAAKAGGGALLRGAHAAYLRGDDDLKRTGGPGFHLWLKEGRWEHWIPKATAAATISTVWTGPPELRNAVVRETSGDFARSYLDTSIWQDGALVPRTGYAADKLRRLRALQGVKILDAQGAAA